MGGTFTLWATNVGNPGSSFYVQCSLNKLEFFSQHDESTGEMDTNVDSGETVAIGMRKFHKLYPFNFYVNYHLLRLDMNVLLDCNVHLHIFRQFSYYVHISWFKNIRADLCECFCVLRMFRNTYGCTNVGWPFRKATGIVFKLLAIYNVYRT